MRKLIITISLILLASFSASQTTDVLTMPTSVGTKFTCSLKPTTVPIIKTIGDVNGDFITDIAVTYSNGIVSIIYGGSNLPNMLDVCTFTDLTIGFRIRSLSGSLIGFGLARVGDLNGDGIADIAVVDNGYSTTTVATAGRIYMIYLPPITGRKLEYPLLSLSFYTFTGSTANAGIGKYITDGIDYNGDGLNDVLVGTATDTNVYILFGASSRNDDTATNALTPSTGVAVTQSAGDAAFGLLPLTSCGDVNSDGVPDYIIMGGSNIFVLYGTNSRPSSSATVTISTTNGLTIPLGTGLTFSTANSVTCADLDMDGRLDIVLSLSDKLVHVLYGSGLKTLATTSVSVKTTTQGFDINSNVISSTFGQFLVRTDGWNGFGQDVLLIADPTFSAVYALYASSANFGATKGLANFNVNTMTSPQQGFIIYTKDPSYKIGAAIDAASDVNGDGIKDLIVAEGTTSNFYAFYGQCQSATGCACPNNMKYKSGYCINQGLSGGQKTGIIVGVIIGAMLLIALGVLVLKKTSCGGNCFDSYAKPAQFGSHTHTPIPQTMATSA